MESAYHVPDTLAGRTLSMQKTKVFLAKSSVERTSTSLIFSKTGLNAISFTFHNK